MESIIKKYKLINDANIVMFVVDMNRTLLTTFLAAGVRNFEQEYIFFPTPATLSQPGQGERNRLVSEHNEHQSAPKAKYTYC